VSKIKICGLRRETDIAYANHCLPDYIGFVFAESRRRVDPETARSLKAGLDPRIQAVGVFVNQDRQLIVSLCRRGIIDGVQLHGDEPETYVQALRREISRPIIQTFAVGTGPVPPALPSSADFLLFDTYKKGRRGGTGESFSWDKLKDVGRPYFLAGGLRPDNLAEALKTLNPYGVDISSGVETDGWKDPDKMAAAVRVVREADCGRPLPSQSII
jgi:phosphoribosylanthranilate isomerase